MAKEQKISVKKQAAPIQPTLPIPEDTLEYAIRLDADALHNLGVLFSVQLLDPKEALSYFEAALNINPTRLQFWFSYLDALIKVGDTQMAEQVLMLASNYGLNELQIASLNRDITLASTTVMDLVDMVLADAAPLPAPQPLAAAQPPAGAELGIGDLQKMLSVFNQKKYQPAIQLIQSMRQKYPHSVEVLKILAETEKRAGHLDKALEARREAAEQQPTQVANQMALADALLDMALKDEAETLLQAILLMQPDYAPALEKMGVLHQNREEFLQALQNYAWAIKNNGINSFVLEKFGASFRALGYQDAALICFKYAVYNSPEKTPELFTAYGVTLRNQERYAAAEDAFRMALKIHSGHIPALHNLCHLLEHYGRFAEAEAGFMRCADLEKGSAATLYEVGRNLLEQKRETEAADWLRRAIQAKPDFVHAHVMLSKALNGGTTTLHALWMGVPTLTVAGDTYPGRQSSAILHNVGLERMCVAKNVANLVDLAKGCALEPQLLNNVRRRLQEMYLSQDEMAEPALVVKSTIHAMRQMWSQWCSGRKPKHLQVHYEDLGITRPKSFVDRG